MTTRARPLLSLCMIVRDEEAQLGRCLASVDGLVDEIVIHDTGSTDGTVALARSLGATVIEGTWRDDFAWARNAALDACRGRWILHLDADEELAGDTSVLRRALQRERDHDALLVDIRNVGATGGDYTHRNVRVFRRAAGRWSGRLHEQVVGAEGRALSRGAITRCHVVHHGYDGAVVAAKDKAIRNLRISEHALADAGADEDRAVLLLNAARSKAALGDHDGAADLYRQARTACTGPGQHAILRLGAEQLLANGLLDEGREWIDALELVGESTDLVAFLRGTANLYEGKPAPELAALAQTPQLMGNDGREVSADLVQLRTAAGLAGAERWAEAAPALLEVLRARPHQPVWTLLVNALHFAGLPMDDAVELVPEDRLRQVLAQVLVADAVAADEFGTVLWARFGGDPRLLGFAAHHAGRLQDLELALPWATKLRNAGMVEHCPVRAAYRDESASAVDRFTAALVGHAAFRDPDALHALDELAGLLTPDEEPVAALLLDELAPELVAQP